VAFAVIDIAGPFAVSALLVMLQAPPPLAVPVPTRMPSANNWTVLFGSAVPVYFGVVTLVRLSPAVPESLAGSSTGVEGALGARVSIVRLWAPDANERFAAASVAFAVIDMAGPLAVNALLVMLQAPPPLAVPVPTRMPSANNCTVLFGSAVPVYVGVVTLVRLSPAVPESLAGSSTGVEGALGAMVSIVTL